MNPIISPVWFYLIDIVDGINLVSSIILLISVILFGAIFICVLGDTLDNNLSENEKSIYVRHFKSILKVIIPCIIIMIFTPNSTTIYKMIVANNVTPHNIEVVGDTIEGGIDYIFEKINGLTLDEIESEE